MLDLGESDAVEELDEGLAGNILLVTVESFDGDKNGGGCNNEDIESVDVWCWEESNADGLRAGQGWMGRFVKWRGGKVWHWGEGSSRV